MTVHAIHHVTAVSGEPRRVLDFYVRVLGMRLVKRTVNFDDPGAYHFYFGDAAGSPGSLFTVFPFTRGRPGRVGAGQVAETALAIPPAALGFWLDRLAAHRVPHELPTRASAELGADGGETVVTFTDPTGCAWRWRPTRGRPGCRGGARAAPTPCRRSTRSAACSA
jgi:glyoxalase family protein